MKSNLSPEEVRSLFEDFLNDKGMWYDFKEFIEEKGYKVSELGFDEE